MMKLQSIRLPTSMAWRTQADTRGRGTVAAIHRLDAKPAKRRKPGQRLYRIRPFDDDLSRKQSWS
jgi:hypothetical protein